MNSNGRRSGGRKAAKDGNDTSNKSNSDNASSAGNNGSSNGNAGGNNPKRNTAAKDTAKDTGKDTNRDGNKDTSSERKLHIIPIGGMGEIGKNMIAMQYEDEILLIDGGLAFPDADMLGVDLLVPKIDWVVENAHKIKGWVLTHGHEDHIGGLPYMLKLLPKIPMYGAKLTLGFLRGKFEEFKLSENDVDLREVTTDDRIKISKYFTVDYFRMTHSIPDNSGFIIHTPIGRIVHSGDFKLDYHPGRRQDEPPPQTCASGGRGRARAHQRLDQRRAPRLHAFGARRDDGGRRNRLQNQGPRHRHDVQFARSPAAKLYPRGRAARPPRHHRGPLDD